MVKINRKHDRKEYTPMKRLLNKLWDERELIFAILLCWVILLVAIFWALPAAVKASMYTGIELGSRLQSEDLQPASADLQPAVSPYEVTTTKLEVR